MTAKIAPAVWSPKFLILALVIGLSLGVWLVAGQSTATASSTITLNSGNGLIGGFDSSVQVSTDGGGTFAPANVIAKHPAWAIISGTQFVYCGPNFGDSCGINKTTLYRDTFSLPAGFSSPSLTACFHADNAATVLLNSVQFGQQPQSAVVANFVGAPECFTTTNPLLFLTGSNTLQVNLLDCRRSAIMGHF